MRKIQRINTAVNKSVAPVSDMDHWGVVDQWDYPTDGKGDCEDYALLKRRMLMDEGFPRQALLMTVVKEANGDGHAVLTVKTNRGEFVLDNLGDEVKAWNRTPYRFVKRQSEQNPNVWVSIGTPTAAPAYVSK
jgi:predicted transglutaminase-like cysteine proteinase